ncbi:hypothetical protein ACJ73_06054 [Blastomyces percursus]|uniref:Uncharacterized protein n=1 Tax=Blastomyces percursus TaxID=1658174 RepID=A0A1J9Q249_9EURO|nr:hypothetical protein ACJ73_06054 [Blastomyces percursus]
MSAGRIIDAYTTENTVYSALSDVNSTVHRLYNLAVLLKGSMEKVNAPRVPLSLEKELNEIVQGVIDIQQQLPMITYFSNAAAAVVVIKTTTLQQDMRTVYSTTWVTAG